MKLKTLLQLILFPNLLLPSLSILLIKDDHRIPIDNCLGCTSLSKSVLSHKDCTLTFERRSVEQLEEELPFNMKCVVPHDITLTFKPKEDSKSIDASDYIKIFKEKDIKCSLMYRKGNNDQDFADLKKHLLDTGSESLINVPFDPKQLPKSLLKVVSEKRKIFIQDIISNNQTFYNVYFDLPKQSEDGVGLI